MNPALRVFDVPENHVLEFLRQTHFAFLTVLSFESRCLAVATQLRRERVSPSFASVASYTAKALPEDMHVFLSEKHATGLSSCLESSEIDFPSALSPYSTNALREQMIAILAKWQNIPILVDISCMTRVHLFVMASLIANNDVDFHRVIFSYVGPRSYSVEMQKTLGWRDTILVPIGKDRSLRREGHARGLILAGHDGERLGIALCELEPASGVLVLANTPRRPDFLQRSIDANISLTKRLLTLRMPRETPALKEAEGWSSAIIDVTDYDKLQNSLAPLIDAALIDEGPIVLFPFGPKSLVLACGIVLASMPELESWAVYPIPDAYPVTYTSGSGKPHYMKIGLTC